MPNYYVRPDGSNANAGTGPAINQAWQTLQYALTNATLGTGVNTIYIAPGIYRETVTINITPTSTNTLVIEGDPTCQQFTGVTAGIVRLTNMASDTGAFSTTSVITGASKTYTTIKKLCVEGTITFSGSSNNLTITQCQLVVMPAGAQTWLDLTLNGNATISNCIQHCLVTTSGGTAGGNNIVLTNNAQVSFFDNVIMSMFGNGFALSSATTGCNVNIYNCTFAGYFNFGIYARPTSTGCVTVRNCIIAGRGANAALDSVPGGGIVEDYNRILYSGTLRSGPSAGTNTTTTGALGLDYGGAYLVGLSPQPFLGRMATSPNTAFGASSGAPAADLYGVTWTNATPDAGAITYSPINTVGPYIPTERNASTITIAPGSTSQSIELYLGATGLTASTSGLSAYYNRTRSADVQINLQARNITQNWTSGGFAEVNPNTMPGVYRLDIPNQALAAGADDVTVVVRGASGTNGAVMSIKLSSGGLTTAQTATAVWGALTSDHTTHGTYGWNVLRADQTSKQGLVGLHQVNNNNRVDADVHAIVNDQTAATYLKGALNHDGTGYIDSDVVRISTSTAAANELEGALLHNGTDYIDSNLLSGNSTRVFVGRFQLTQTGTTQGDIIEAFTTDTPSFELQLFDGDNNIVPVTGATLGLRILDVTSTVVETGTPTIEYGTGGIVRWTAPGSYVSIGCPAGMYRLFVDRTVSGTTTTFGPLQIKVQVQ